MNIPPYVCCFLFLNTVGNLIHRGWIRPWTCAVAIESTTIVCYIILVTVHSPVVKYIALIVAVSCAGSAYPVIWPERIRALEGTVAAGVGIGLTNACAQWSGIVGPHVYSTIYGPTYHKSYGQGVRLGWTSGRTVPVCNTTWGYDIVDMQMNLGRNGNDQD
ncbi:hypothetical protein G647_10040 [Cladophialophora carrionii CBS 160.54]|uniref:Uncharacterized protein n=1 Tax=Cladophialophora carrionii CBS 160.54 TaxID=1279043 RepID=V9DJT1_9EURO|nr:uncharacterized protein G647_10040 [Cladophialophora carrionii CBS 160.54]ETI26941.1 hypothetical protein G647_10040 [Cladophialophora carrionii CBS 160.54]